VRKLLVLLLLVLGTGIASAQKIYVDSTIESDDLIGSRFAFAFKEQLRKSASYVLVDGSYGDGLTLSMVSTSTSEKHASALSIVLTVRSGKSGDLLLNHWVMVVGNSRVDEMANTLLAKVDESAGALRQALNETKAKPVVTSQ